MPLPRPRRARLPACVAAAAAALVLVAGTLAPARPAWAGDAAPHLDAARKKTRQQDLKGALVELEQAVAADPSNVDANILYQDLARNLVGSAGITSKYSEAAAKGASDPVAQFLLSRLSPPDAALKEFERQAVLFPGSPWPHAGRARAFQDLGQWDKASAELDLAVDLAGTDAPRFAAYRAWGLERGGKWTAAVEAWRLVVSKSPSDPTAKAGLGESLRRSGSMDEALVLFEEMRKADPKDAEAVYRVGLCHLDAGRTEPALAAFKAALAIDRGMVEALCAMTEAEVRAAKNKAHEERREVLEKDFLAALTLGDRAVVSAPDSAYAHFTLAAAHEAIGEVNADHLETALQEYDHALEKMPLPGPEKVRAFTAKSYVLLRLARWGEAQAVADLALAMDPKCAAAWGHAAHALAAPGRQKDAIEKYYRPGIKACPDDPRLAHDLGVALWEMKKPNDAKKPLEDAVRLAPTNGEYKHSLGELYYELKRYKDAEAVLYAATQILPKDDYVWGSYAKACYSNKSWKECTLAFEKVIELHPESVNEHLYLAVVYANQMNDKMKARPHIEKFREKGGTDENLDSWMNQILEETKNP